MAWARRRARDSTGEPSANQEQDAISAFWMWWREDAATTLASAFDSGTVEGVAEMVTPQVQAMHPALAWEFGPGLTSRHRLVVTAEGDPAVRSTARRWLRAAPPPDDTWSFHDMRQPGSVPPALTMDGHEIDTARVRIGARPAGTGLDVTMHHPDFGQLPESTRHRIAFVLLDTVLGEELVELWVGRVEASVAEQSDGHPLDQLPELVADVVQAGTEDGEMRWTVLRGQGPDGPVLATSRARLSSVQYPQADQHVRVEVPYTDLTPDGWPGEGSLGELRDLEDHLGVITGDAGRLVATESCAGRRVLHFFVDSTLPVADQLRAASSGWRQGAVTITSQPDPGWTAVAHLRT